MIKIAKSQYEQMKNIMQLMNEALIKGMNEKGRIQFMDISSRLRKIINNLQLLYEDIDKEFDDGKITKNTY